MKKVISIFSLPQEIDELEQLLLRLKTNLNYVNPSEYIVDISLGLSDQLIDWKSSTLPKEYFLDKFNILSKLFPNINCRISEDILGCVSQRRYTWKYYQDCDYFIWLDTDIIFDSTTLYYLDQAIESIYPKYPLSIITPEIVKIWDYTWDCLVNDQFIKYDYGYEKINDPYKDCGVKGDISLKPVYNQIVNEPFLKFAGGWFTGLSKPLLDKITIPDSLGHYGYEDTLIMHACNKLNIGSQFKIENLVICENYKYRDHTYLSKYLKIIDNKDKFRKIALKAANNYLLYI